jgi:tripartite-type tricarboxylate transporter receptor subunit TctC
MKALIAVFAAAAALTGHAFAAAPPYPAKPVRMITPYAPGAGTDVVARLIAKDFTDAWEKQVIVDNRPGGTGTVGAMALINAPADGYTVFMGTSAVMVTNPLMSAKVAYDPQKDFAPIGRATVLPPLLTAHPSVPAKSIKDVIALARAKPGTLNFASSGQGSPHHLALELLKSMTGIDVVHVPYKGGAPAVTDTLAGQVQLCFSNVTTLMPHVRAGRLRAIGVGSAKRSAAAPDVPTIAESGVPGFDYGVWYGFFAPARTPQPIVDKITAQLRKTLSTPAVSDQLVAQGAEPAYLAPAELREYIIAETRRWSKIVKAGNLRLDS